MAVKLGIIGFGIMGERLLRAALAHDPSVVTLSGIFDPSPDAPRRLRAIRPDLKAFASAEALIAASDCLHIASPPGNHLAQLKLISDAGKAALCEKPLAIDVAAATAAVEALKSAKLRAGVNFPFASSLAVEQLARWRQEGFVGDLERIEIALGFAAWPRGWQMDAVTWLDGRAEGGFVREVASHFLFLALRMGGPLQLVSATTAYPVADQSERSVAAKLLAGRVPVSLIGAVGLTQVDDENTCTITGALGRIRLRNWSIAERDIGGTWQAPSDAVPNEVARPHVLARQLDKLAALTRGEATTLATLDEALAVQTVVEAILRSA
jgi:predicted dehydrogenase